jgi:leucyl/phenylalanyl-tRNA--protein transferase
VVSDIVRVTKRLSVCDVEAAYREGIFPMAVPEARVITWHRPRRRAILPLNAFHVSRSLAHALKQHRYQVTIDRAFAAVMDACADRDETWISDEIKAVYGKLHSEGKAHSLEVWADGELSGGLYGVHLGGAFFAESKFHRRTDMSKVALAELVFRLRDRGFALLEVQYVTPHLAQFGVIEIPDREYRQRLREALALPRPFL